MVLWNVTHERCYGGSAPAGRINNIQYVTISTTGNAADFGDLLKKLEHLVVHLMRFVDSNGWWRPSPFPLVIQIQLNLLQSQH